MKQFVFKLSLLCTVVLLFASCTKTMVYPYFCYVEYDGDETDYYVECVDKIHFRTTEYITKTSNEKNFYFYNTIEAFTTGGKSALDRIEYRINRIHGTARCTLYVANYERGKDNPLRLYPDKEFVFTDEVKAWLHENYIAKCFLERGERDASLKVLLVQ